MIRFFEAFVEEANDHDFTLKNIDPRDKAYNAEEDDLFYKEAYSKATVSMNEMYHKITDLIHESRLSILDTANRCTLDENKVVATLHTLSLNPSIPCNILSKIEKDFVTTGEISIDGDKDISDEAFRVNKMIILTSINIPNGELQLSTMLGRTITGAISKTAAKCNLLKLVNSMCLLEDEYYAIYNHLIKRIIDTRNTSDVELIARFFEFITNLFCSYCAAYISVSMELFRLCNFQQNIMQEASGTNEENVKQYLHELDKLIDDIRDFYDNFEYKEILTPRKKKETKMYEYMLGALQRKYTLRIPMYKVVGKSTDVKEIVENKFIKKIETITKNYPNFCILSPEWDKEDDMFIYVTLREPFGEKEDRGNREDQVKTMQEASMSTKERAALDSKEFGLPEQRKYPLNDETHIREAINKFGFCKPEFKKELASNIVRRTLLLGLFDKVYVSEKHPNKSFFPEWFIGKASEKGYSLNTNGNKYTIIDSDGKKVDWYTIKSIGPINESIIFNSDGKLY